MTTTLSRSAVASAPEHTTSKELTIFVTWEKDRVMFYALVEINLFFFTKKLIFKFGVYHVDKRGCRKLDRGHSGCERNKNVGSMTIQN